MAPRKFTVTHPDGTVSKRTSQNRQYAFAVVHKVDQREQAAMARRDAAESRRRAAELDKAADGSVTETREPWIKSQGGEYVRLSVGGAYADTYVDGGIRSDERPTDEALRANVRDQAAVLRDNAERLDDRAERLDSGPEFTYEVLRWSRSHDLAEKAARGEFGRDVTPGRFSLQHGRDEVYVVPVDA